MLSWSVSNGRKFPWRESGLSSYQYIIAEVLLQRTKAETIATFFPKFIVQFPTWRSLVRSDVKEIETFLKPVGLYQQRSSRLKHLALEMEKRSGKLPTERKALEAIPYMGQYIANAVELIIFDQPAPLIDVNMARVLERFFGPRSLADIRYDPYLQSLARKVVDHADAKQMNWAILDFAALVCKPKPKCLICPIAIKCTFYESLIQAQ